MAAPKRIKSYSSKKMYNNFNVKTLYKYNIYNYNNSINIFLNYFLINVTNIFKIFLKKIQINYNVFFNKNYHIFYFISVINIINKFYTFFDIKHIYTNINNTLILLNIYNNIRFYNIQLSKGTKRLKKINIKNKFFNIKNKFFKFSVFNV